MHNRLRQLIDLKTNGNQSKFAAMMNWTPQYLYRLLKGGGLGLRPVITILEKFPDVNARWLLLGEGAMLVSCVEAAKDRLLKMLCYEKYMSVMSPEELQQYSQGNTEFDLLTLYKWDNQLKKSRHDHVGHAGNHHTV